MTHTLIYIGASILQVPAIGWAKTQGLRVVVTDMNPDAPGIAFADEYAQLSGDNVDGIVALAGEVSCSTTLVGCYCGSDFGLPAVSAVAEHFDVPGPSRESVNLSLNKSAAISVMRDHGVTVPKGSVVNSHEELVLEANRLGFPVIVKPADSSGSRGVRAVKCAEYLACAYDEAKKFSSKIMVRSCVRGHHVDVNGLFVEGTFYPCGMLSRFFLHRHTTTPLGDVNHL